MTQEEADMITEAAKEPLNEMAVRRWVAKGMNPQVRSLFLSFVSLFPFEFVTYTR